MTDNMIFQWIDDYFYLVKGRLFLFIKPPQHYIYHVLENRPTIILIPGLHEKWHFLKTVADPISLTGCPVYIAEQLGYNDKAIDYSAKLIRKLIEEKNLNNIIIIAHSKGGLIAKYLLAFDNQDERIKKVIAIATPFHGSQLVEFIPTKVYKELGPESPMIEKLNSQTAVNNKIISIFGKFDNHVWPTESCRLEGAQNIQVDVYGHHKILFDEKVRKIILEEIEKI
jgi:triacylglycerol lipase